MGRRRDLIIELIIASNRAKILIFNNNLNNEEYRDRDKQ